MNCPWCGGSAQVVSTLNAYREKCRKAEEEHKARFVRTRVLEEELFVQTPDGTFPCGHKKKADEKPPRKVLASIREMFPGLQPLPTLRDCLKPAA